MDRDKLKSLAIMQGKIVSVLYLDTTTYAAGKLEYFPKGAEKGREGYFVDGKPIILDSILNVVPCTLKGMIVISDINALEEISA